ncbi:MAG TPA: glutathione S-transferase family protein [Trichocoleus sp.]|jgi:glutathione S-transferase
MSLTLIIGNKNYSSWSLRAWLMLKQARVAFEEIRVPLDTPETADRLRSYSPSAKVPVLKAGTLTIWESIAIGEYIAEQVPEAQLLPQDAAVRAIVRSVSAEMHAGFAALRQKMPMDCRSRYPGRGMTLAVQRDIDRITTLWRGCRQQYGSSGDFLFGHFTLADAMYAPVVSRFVTYGVALEPMAQAYADTIWRLPTMQEWVSAAAIEPETLSETLLFGG